MIGYTKLTSKLSLLFGSDSQHLDYLLEDRTSASVVTNGIFFHGFKPENKTLNAYGVSSARKSSELAFAKNLVGQSRANLFHVFTLSVAVNGVIIAAPFITTTTSTYISDYVAESSCHICPESHDYEFFSGWTLSRHTKNRSRLLRPWQWIRYQFDVSVFLATPRTLLYGDCDSIVW